MAKICIVALIGLPAVGKTSFSKQLLEIENLPFNILHINYDDFLNVNPDSGVSFKQQRNDLLSSLATLMQSLKISNTFPNNLLKFASCDFKDLHTDRLLILCDDNHYYRSMRYNLYQIARQYNLSYGQLYFECLTDMAIKRNRSRGSTDKVPDEVIHKMSKYLEPPQYTAYSWEANTFKLHAAKIEKQFIVSNVVPYMLQLFKNPLKPLQSEQVKCVTKQSQVHDFDLFMRKKIGLILSSKVDVDKQHLAQMLNTKRRDLLQEVQGNSNIAGDEDIMKYIVLFEDYLEEVG